MRWICPIATPALSGLILQQFPRLGPLSAECCAIACGATDGHVHAFAFFGRVPHSVLYGNDRCLVAKIMPDGSRKRTKLLSGFLSHYFIQDRYGRPGKGNDKGAVEGLVGYG